MTRKTIISAATTAIIFLLLPEVGMSRIEALASVYFIFSVCLCLTVWVDELMEEAGAWEMKCRRYG